MTTFESLGLSERTLQAIETLGFKEPSEIQAKVIPQLLFDYTDLIGLAQTGTGKTAAFILPLIERIDSSHDATQALIIAPTRELCQQIGNEFEKFAVNHKELRFTQVYGGANISTQLKILKKTQHIIIATPGRLRDLIRRKAIKLDQLHVLVLDEADEMLNMGFKEEIDDILLSTPEDIMTWLFSATMPPAIKHIVDEYMVDPIEVKINTKLKVNPNISHQYVLLKPRDKFEALCRFLDKIPDMRGVVFCRTRRDTQNLAEMLMTKNYQADALHGDLTQGQRDRVMKRFKNHQLQVLIATDVAARGIDVSNLTHVFHYSLPDDNSYYTHRSGRTGRAGNKGTSIAFVVPQFKFKIPRIEKQLKINIEKIDIPSFNEILEVKLHNYCQSLVDQDSSGGEVDKYIDYAETLLKDVSKTEIIRKLMVQAFSNLNSESKGNINLDEDKSWSDKPSRGRSKSKRGRPSRKRPDKRRGKSSKNDGKASNSKKEGKVKRSKRHKRK